MEIKSIGSNPFREIKIVQAKVVRFGRLFFSVIDKNFVAWLAILAFIALQMSQESYCHPKL